MSSTTADRALPLHGQAALITGASRGIGMECARVLHAAGARLALVGRNLDGMHEFVTTHGPRGAPIAAFRCDLADPGSTARALQAVRKQLGDAPDILVNNAGRFVLASIEKTDVEEFERTLRVNLTAQFAFVREFIGDMRARKRGHIVTIGSIADHRAFPENAAYAASKFGARGLHEVLREELRGTGVRATLVSPGPVDTPLWDDVKPEKRKGHTPRALMLRAAAVADAVRYVVTQPDDVNIDELRLSRS